MSGKDEMDCSLCGKKIPVHWRRVCEACFKLWELGRKRVKMVKSDGRLGHARVVLVVKTDGEDGDPVGDTAIKSGDLIAAMGAVKLRGTSMGGRFDAPDGTVFVGKSVRHGWMSGGAELVQVPEARAKAMARIVAAFFNALAKAKVDGFNSGRSLLTALAEGSVTVSDFQEMSDKAMEGKRWR